MAEPDQPEAPETDEAAAAATPAAAEAPAPAAADAPAPAAADAPAPAPAAADAGAADDPQTRQLRAAVGSFMSGDFGAARRGVRELLHGELPPELKKQADDLVRRLGLDPVALWVAVGSTVLFIVVVILTYRR